MPKRYAILENNIVINVIIATDDFVSVNYPDAILSPEHICVGDKYENGEFYKVVVIAPKVEDEAETF